MSELTPDELSDLRSVEHVQAKGFAGMFTGRAWPKRDTERLVAKDLLNSEWMDVADDNGFVRDGCKPRVGYFLTPQGRLALTDTEAEWARQKQTR